MEMIEMFEDVLEDCAPEGIATPPMSERLQMFAPLAFAGQVVSMTENMIGGDRLVAERRELTRTNRIVEFIRSI